MSRLVVLASGSGSNLQAMLDAGLPVVAVVSQKPDAFALERARKAGVAAVCCALEGDRRAYDAKLADVVRTFSPDLVVMAGWMHILSRDFLDHFTVVNLHPALPGQFPGIHAIERAFAAGVPETGVMIHLVPDEGVDSGPVLAQQVVPILADDTLDTLTARVHAVEHELLVKTVQEVLARGPSSAFRIG